MGIIDMELRDFNLENLKSYLLQEIDYAKLYQDETISTMLEQNVLSRLQMFTAYKNITFIAEREYIETEWKDMIALHYINTTYSCSPSVVRIHLFSKKQKISNETYLGFFTIRKINELNVALSYIYPNFAVLRKWNNTKSNKKKYYLMGYLKKVHIEGIEINMFTFPMFVQDGTVASCTHASMISMVKYLHYRHNFPSLSMESINNDYTFERTKTYPTKGLGYQQIVEVFSKKGIYVHTETISTEYNEEKKHRVWDEEKVDTIKRFIDTNIESGLPVMVLGDYGVIKEDGRGRLIEHSILIIGHTINNKREREYIIYDDSGALLEKVCGHSNIIGVISWTQFIDICIYANVLFPQYERVYLNCDDIKSRLVEWIQPNTQVCSTNQVAILNMRYLLIDNCMVKKVFKDLIVSNELISKENRDEIEIILKKNLPHYIWYCELEVAPGAYFVYIADPTYNNDTMINVFINTQALLLNKQLCLLSPQGESEYNVEGNLHTAVFGIKDKAFGRDLSE